MALIQCENITLTYEGFTVLKDLSFSVADGSYLCIIGENGTGKSTLLKAMLGLKAVAAGKILYGEGLRQCDIGYVAQKTEVQKDFPASVMEVVLSGCLNRSFIRPFYTRSEKEAARRAMAAMEIAELEKKCFRELSGGQQQRVLLTRALCATKRVLFLDEPVTGLDAPMTTAFFNRVQDLNHNEGITIVMVSHDIHCAVKYADHILHLHGERSFFGLTEDYIKSDMGKEFIGGHRHD